jgi:FMN phosphatase YigB (HAD superfamily)
LEGSLLFLDPPQADFSFAEICYSEGMQKPLLFLDFDRTLFDTGQFYEWLGEKVDERILELTSGTIAPPDFPAMLYPDTVPFLLEVRKNYHLVLLTYTAHITRALQEKKVFGSGLTAYVDDVLIVSGERGSGGKAKEVEHLAGESDNVSATHVFVDDRPENISEVKELNPAVLCIRIDRAGEGAHGDPLGLIPPDALVRTLPELLAVL